MTASTKARHDPSSSNQFLPLPASSKQRLPPHPLPQVAGV
jgi:hypothetical protein